MYSLINIQDEFLSKKRLSISNDILAVVDSSNNKAIKFFDMSNGKIMNFTVEHTMEIQEIHLNQTDMAGERKVAFVDQNRDLHISPVHKKDIVKLASMTDSFMWHEKYDMLAAISDARLVSWYYPTAVYVDRDLLEQVKFIKESNDIARNAQMLSFTESKILIRRKDGAEVNLSISPYPSILFEFCEKGKWEKAIKLCRFVKESTLWASLAGLSLQFRELATAEIALAAIEAADKVQFISKVISMPSDVSKNAMLAIFFKKNQEAENIYIQSKLYYRAIKMNVKLFKWEHALELAQQYKVHVDTVVGYRQRYLQQTGKEESINKFSKLSKEVQVDWEAIKQRIKAEKAKEEQLR